MKSFPLPLTKQTLVLIHHLLFIISSQYHLQTLMMSQQRETNPHFLPRQQPPDQPQPLQPEHDPNSHFPIHQQQPQDDPNLHFPIHQQPQPQPQPQHQDQHPQPQHRPSHTQPQRQPRRQRQQQPRHPTQRTQQPPQHQPSSLILAPPHKTKTRTWFIGVFCALFWIIIIVGGLIILIVYLLFRPRSPKFDVSSATLNAAYLDMGYLLNADLTLLANFTNPNKKVKVDFSYMLIDLYFQNTRIATRYVEPFSALNYASTFTTVHMVSSQVPLPLEQSLQLRGQMENNSVRFEIKGLFRTRSDLGSFLRYSYWLYGHCNIVMTGPPSGVLVAKKCRTKR